MIHWYSYAQFRHTRTQTFWALQEADYFEADRWPPEPQVDPVNNDKGEYMTDVLIDDEKTGTKRWAEQVRVGLSVAAGAQGHQAQAEGRFCKCRCIIGEINKRLALTKHDGKVLLQEIERGKVRDIDGLSDVALIALTYISGKDRRVQSYSNFKGHWNYSRKGVKV